MYIRNIEFKPAWDKRDPDPKKNYGVHGVDLIFTVRKDNKTVWFKVFTMWHYDKDIHNRFSPTPADLGYHSPRPMYDKQLKMSDDCAYTNGVCYYDGSGLNAEIPWKILLEEGSDKVFEFLEKYHKHVFNDASWPE